ncbi:hypothetical protein HHK36_024564 [Tetracentron sinense]|uniref:Uncharacterized protein n=1 Tax=Tetracentron sinense TaxID=13715 RepID=A0A835D4D1_TETSI|nr:hypothetical protein HHK36_024564 [Tetracentron sinense]
MAMVSYRDVLEDGEEISCSDNDDDFDEDMEALRRACMLTGANPNELKDLSSIFPAVSESEGDSSNIDDLDLVRNIQQRFSLPPDANPPLVLKPLQSLPPIVSDDDDDDFETLRAIQRRFSKYSNDSWANNTENYLKKPELVHATIIASEQEDSNHLFVNRNNACEEFPNSDDVCNANQPLESFGDMGPGNQPSGFTELHQPEARKLSMLPLNYSSFPKSAQVFIDAIKKNRSCQKFVRSKLIQIEARIEENKKLKELIKVLKDFQVSCKKRTGRALSQKKDARVQLISLPKSRTSQTSKVNDKKVSALCFGPAENSHVANYRIALTKFPLSLSRQHWSKSEQENLGKGIKQQFQEMLLQKSVNLLSDSEGPSGDPNDFDSIIASITDFEITSENVRSFLPKVEWERLASMYVMGRSGAECEARYRVSADIFQDRWLNYEDPLINHNEWTNIEDKNLLLIVQQSGLHNWIDIAIRLGSNRTPFQCLARYQRSLNAYILKRDWTEDEDAQLRAAVEAFGEDNWQLIASNLEGRASTQCSNRWRKSLHPARERVGRWTLDEDKRLKVAVMLFGPKSWRKIAQFISGRTQVQCRERWVNCLDPSLNLEEWTEEEDFRLKAAIVEHRYCWSKVAAAVPPRTDSQCRRRWKVLLPHEVPLLQAARKIQKAALISNFVDREAERPALGPCDFLPLPGTNSITEYEKGNASGKENKKSRKMPKFKKKNDTDSCDVPKKIPSKRSRTKSQTCPEGANEDGVETFGGGEKKSQKRPKNKKEKDADSCDVPKKIASKRSRTKAQIFPEGANRDGVETLGGGDNMLTKKKKVRKLRSKRNKCTEPTQDHQKHSFSPEDSTFLRLTNGDEEAFGGDDTTSKKRRKASKPRSNKNRCTEPAQDQQDIAFSPEHLTLRIANGDDIETFCGDNMTSNKKRRAPKPRSKKNKCTELSHDHQDLTLSHEHSRIIRITNGDDVETFCGNDTTPKRRKVPKLQPKRNRSIEPAQDHQDLSSFPEHTTMLRITDADDVETFGGEEIIPKKTRKAPKAHLKKDRCVESAQDHQNLPLPPEHSTFSRITNGDDVETYNGNTVLKNKEQQSCLKRDKCIGSAQGPQDITSTEEHLTCDIMDASLNGKLGRTDVNQHGRPKKLRSKDKSCSKEILETTAGDDVTLASFLCNKVKRKRLELANNGDITLASFLRNKVKRRRLELAKNGEQASFPGRKRKKASELLSEGEHQAHDVYGAPSLLQDCEAQTYCSNGMTGMLSFHNTQTSRDIPTIQIVAKELATEDSLKGRTVALYESVNEVVSLNLGGSYVVDDNCALSPSSSSSPPPGFGSYTTGVDIIPLMEGK